MDSIFVSSTYLHISFENYQYVLNTLCTKWVEFQILLRKSKISRPSIAQLVERETVEESCRHLQVTGSNPVRGIIFSVFYSIHNVIDIFFGKIQNDFVDTSLGSSPTLGYFLHINDFLSILFKIRQENQANSSKCSKILT